MKNISLRKILVLYTFLIFMLPILIIGIGSIVITTIYLKNNVKENHNSFLNVIEKNIKDFFKNCEKDLLLLSFYIKERQFFSNYATNMIDVGNFEKILLLDKNGIIKDIYPSNFKDFIGFDYSNEKSIKFAIDKKDYSIDLIRYSFLNDKPSLIIAMPVIENDKIIGVVAGIVKFNKLRNNILELKECCAKMEFIITDRDGTVILHPDMQKMEQIETIDYIKDLRENVFNLVRIENDFYFVKYKIIKKINWIVVTLQNYNFIIALFNKISFLFLINILVGIVITIIALIVGAALIIKPIYSISYKTSLVSHGKYNIEKENYIIEELNSLSINLNKMVKKISQREEELRISENKYRKLIENSLDFIFKLDKKFNFTFISSSIENLLGYSSEEFKSNFKNILVKNRMNIISRRKIKDIFRTKLVPDPFNLELIHKNGYHIVLELQVAPIIENDNVIEVQGIARDITSRFYAEQQVIYLKNYLLNLIETMPSALITLDLDGRVTNLNSNALKIINRPKEEILGKILWKIEERFLKYLSYFNYVIEKNKMIEFREEETYENGEVKFFNVVFFPLKWEDSMVIGLRIDDVTHIEKTQMQLREVQKLETIGTIASGLSHDFNNILGAILGALRVIEERTKDKRSINCSLLNEDLETIKEASKKATHIVQQLMNFSRKQNIKFEVIDLNSEIKNVINIFSKSLGNKDIKIIFEDLKEPVWIEGNSTLIEQMILNLLLNARDAIATSGKVTINLKKVSHHEIKDLIENSDKKEFIEISIADTGKGIADDLKKKIFTPLFTTKKKGDGTGLGLSMVYNIVKNHKGYITFESKLNEGTVFYIYLPSVDIHNDKEILNIKKGGHGILIIDDDQYIRYTTEQILKECGYIVWSASNGEEALKILKENSGIDLILFDLIMPGLSGKELAKEILNLNKNYKILLTSGTKNDTTYFELENMGIRDFILKPFTFEEIAETIYNLLNKNI